MITIKRHEYKTIQIKPNSGVRNYYTEQILKTVYSWFKLPIDKVERQGFRLIFEPQERMFFETRLEHESITFYITVPENVLEVMMKKLESLPGWEKVSINIVDTPVGWEYNDTLYRLHYKYADFYAIHTDSKDNLPLRSLLQSVKNLEEGEKASFIAYFDPVNHLQWRNDHKNSMEKLRKGEILQKNTLSRNTLIVLNEVLKQLLLGISELMSTKNYQNVYENGDGFSEMGMSIVDSLQLQTKRKGEKPAFRTSMWVLADCKDDKKADDIARTMAGSFSELASDNEFEYTKVKKPGKVQKVLTLGKKSEKEEVIDSVNNREPVRVNFKYNTLSSEEAGKLVQLPGHELQDDFTEVKAVEHRETQVSKNLLEGGLYLGDITYRGQGYSIYQPTSSYDEICLPSVAIAGMGQGKTRGFGANYLYEAVMNGFGGVAIDPAKGEIADELKKVLPDDKLEVIELGDRPVSLDWVEVRHGVRARGNLANTIISFFENTTEEVGGQTTRYLRAFVKAMQTDKLSELFRIIEDEDYREQVTQQMPEGLSKRTLESFSEESPQRQRQVIAPIYNRLDVILGDEYLSECVESGNSLDMVELMSKKKAVVINVPKSKLRDVGVNVIISLLSTKIDLAMTLRSEENQFPYFVIFDEPHQFIASSRIWKNAAVESRKWRVSYVWMFHSWEQINSDLAEIIKSAGPHYHIYRASKRTFRDLQEEIYPFTIEEGIKLKRFHAINVLHAGGETHRPFIMNMAKPPSKRLKNS